MPESSWLPSFDLCSKIPCTDLFYSAPFDKSEWVYVNEYTENGPKQIKRASVGDHLILCPCPKYDELLAVLKGLGGLDTTYSSTVGWEVRCKINDRCYHTFGKDPAEAALKLWLWLNKY